MQLTNGKQLISIHTQFYGSGRFLQISIGWWASPASPHRASLFSCDTTGVVDLGAGKESNSACKRSSAGAPRAHQHPICAPHPSFCCWIMTYYGSPEDDWGQLKMIQRIPSIHQPPSSPELAAGLFYWKTYSWIMYDVGGNWSKSAKSI